MSTFIIFIIVLTLGYVLYYAAMITIDLTAKEKSETVTEETIDADDEDDDEDEFAPRNVSEDSANGGFSISDPDTSDVEEASEEISEADEQSPEDDAHHIEANEDPSETESATNGDVEDVSDIEESDDEQPSNEQSSDEGAGTHDQENAIKSLRILLELLLVRADTLGTTCRRSLIALDTSHCGVYLIVLWLHLFVCQFLADNPLCQRTAYHRTGNQAKGSSRHTDCSCARQSHAFKDTRKSRCRTMSACHGYTTCSHTNQRINTHESGTSHWH